MSQIFHDNYKTIVTVLIIISAIVVWFLDEKHQADKAFEERKKMLDDYKPMEVVRDNDDDILEEEMIQQSRL